MSKAGTATERDDSFDDPIRELIEIDFGKSHEPGRLCAYVPGETNEQFHDLRMDTQGRLGMDELTNGQFLQMLMDCWTVNLEDEMPGGDDV